MEASYLVYYLSKDKRVGQIKKQDGILQCTTSEKKYAMFPECLRITLILAVEVIVYSRYTFFLEKFNNFKTHKNIIFRNIFTFWVHFVMATTYSLGISSKDMSNWKILYFLEVITQLSTPSTVRFFYLLGLKKSFFRLTWLPSFSSQYTKNWKWHHKKNHGRKDLCFHRFPMNIVSKTASRRIVQVSKVNFQNCI